MFRISSKVIRSYFRRADPFYDEQENHSLIGVANVFLESLFYDVKLQYAVPIINQKGEVGSLLVPCVLQRAVQEHPGWRQQTVVSNFPSAASAVCVFSMPVFAYRLTVIIPSAWRKSHR